MGVTLEAAVSDEVLIGAVDTCGRFGMTVSEAVVSVDRWAPNSETLAAMREAELGLDEEVSLEQLLSQFDEDHKRVDRV